MKGIKIKYVVGNFGNLHMVMDKILQTYNQNILVNDLVNEDVNLPKPYLWLDFK